MLPLPALSLGALALAPQLLSLAVAQWVVETNSLRVTEPSSAREETDAAIGDFGVPMYGGTLKGELVYLPKNTKACEEISEPFPKSSELPVFLLADRGDCYFVEKAFNAERAGAQALVVADYRDEKLLTMATPEERPEIAKLKNDVTIPTALVTLGFGDKLKKLVGSEDGKPQRVVVELDWKESVMNPDERVEWELWTSSNPGCGGTCDAQAQFKIEMRDDAVELEKGGYTQFTPHFMGRRCAYEKGSEECKEQCIHQGRYCGYDSIVDQYSGDYKGWQVAEENKRQLCAFNAAKHEEQPWRWWTYVAAYAERCTMASKRFATDACAEHAAKEAGLDAQKIHDCMGDSTKDEDHPLMEADLDAQGSDEWGNGKILLEPTVIVNTNQYRGRLEASAVTHALCAGFSETTEPDVCLAGGMEVNECEGEGRHDCWTGANATACIDTFRGYQCRCPQGYRGNGKTCEDIDECKEGISECGQICTNTEGGYLCSCREGFTLYGGKSAIGLCLPEDRCLDENAGCEQLCTSRDGTATCSCREGLKLAKDERGCEDVDECKEGSSKCEQVCVNEDPRETGQPYSCRCNSGFATDPHNAYMCLRESTYLASVGVSAGAAGGSGGSRGLSTGLVVAIVAVAAAITCAAGFAVHRWRSRHVMQSEIREIMRQYMPLEGNNLEEGEALSPRIKSSGSIKLTADARALPPQGLLPGDRDPPSQV